MPYWDKKHETMPLQDLKELQLKRLKNVVRTVYEKNEFYHKKLKDAGVKPDDIKTLDDITKIPFLTKDDLRQYYPFGLLCVPLDEVVEVHASSGTTGKPVVGAYTKNDLEVWGEVMARSLYANGLRRGDVMQNAYGYGLFTGAHGFEKGAQKIGAMVVPISSGNTKRQITIMKDFGTTALASTPSYSLYMAEVAEEMGFSPADDFKLRLGLFGAEAWSDEMRKAIEKRWGITAYEHYGLTEIIGPGVVSECEEKHLHINADHFLPEVIDPKTGEQLEPGEEGELVFTTLTKEAFPVLRFRTKDIAVYTEEECECGRTLPIQSRIKGRSDDMMKVKGVIVFPSQVEEAMMKVEGISGNYVLVKERKGAMTSLKVRVEPTEERYSQGSLGKLAEAAEEEIYAMLNIHVPVEIVEPNSLPRSVGKAKRVVEE
ncbi:MAG: phenylacetate--CoA ligase [Thermoplasmata archaeon]|nr:MAG: phenylacetate--CoA ligase [Thermoplasmata archaeon]MCD6146816.1 phenylacetate--CoA ligase [Thermoplasmata archaeon]HHH84026.1 phenylacetate--CoA ligase family protein [Thermoplasmatales archaeon]